MTPGFASGGQGSARRPPGHDAPDPRPVRGSGGSAPREGAGSSASCPPEAIILGAGLAGLSIALALCPHPCTILTPTRLGEGAASAWAQGGIAAAIGADDTPALHLADTLAAGAGLTDPAIAEAILTAGPAAIDALAAMGVRFDRNAEGEFRLGLEAGHGRRRIVHAAGDASGAEILRAVIAAVRAAPSITVREGFSASRLILRDGRITGVLAHRVSDGAPLLLGAACVAIATGGAGGLYRATTNPAGALGTGLLLAARAGAVLSNLEFVQFHPTALAVGLDPMPLISEAVRGEGAVLIDDLGERFLAGQGAAELSPRDVVSRAVWARMSEGRRVFLDARAAVPDFARRFPGIAARCLQSGIDPATMPIPVRPAAHYHMGGIAVDSQGRTSVPGLWAAGEAACTGLHGANRLASNSLLEAVVAGGAAGRSMQGDTARAPLPLAGIDPPPASHPAPVRDIMERHAGVLRDATGLRQAIGMLRPLARRGDGPATLGLMMAIAMRAREESRGGHCRTDFTNPHPASRPSRLRLGEDGVVQLDCAGTPTVEEAWPATAARP